MQKIKETITTLLQAARYSFGFCWRNSRAATLGRIVFAFLTTLSACISLQAMGFLMNAVQHSPQELRKGNVTFMQLLRSEIGFPLKFLLIILIVDVVLEMLDWFCRSVWGQKLNYANHREINTHRESLDVACFRSKEYDDLIRRIGELPSAWRTRASFSEDLLRLFTRTVSFVLFGASLLLYKPLYALILAITVLPTMFVEFQLVSRWWNLSQDLVPHHKERHVLEKPYHIPTAFVQALTFNQMPWLRRSIQANVDVLLSAYDKVRVFTLQRKMFTHLFSASILGGVMAHAVWTTVITGGGIGTLTIVLAAARTFQNNLGSIVSLVAEQWNSAKGVILIEKDFFGLRPSLVTENPITPQFEGVPCIEFKGVSFAYPKSNVCAVKNVSFSLRPRHKVAIVGQSGSGKSTLQALLSKHYHPTSGSICVDGINLQDIPPLVWNNVVSSLSQEFIVLERTVGQEIASSDLGRPFDLEAVATSAHFADFVKVIEACAAGYNTQIGTAYGGKDFSGGEKKRLALARAHYRGTPIFILDEPDAHLDPLSAQRIMDNIFALTGITVVIITHHVASVAERCDHIIVMKQGEVVEQGTHAELMGCDGEYASMYRKDQKRLG